jgi:hypothetical protein
LPLKSSSFIVNPCFGHAEHSRKIAEKNRVSDSGQFSRLVRDWPFSLPMRAAAWAVRAPERLMRAQTGTTAKITLEHDRRVDIAGSGSSFSCKEGDTIASPDQEKRHDDHNPPASPAFFR